MWNPEFLREGFAVSDTLRPDRLAARFPSLHAIKDVEEALAGAELVLLLTEWPLYRDLDPTRVGRLVAARRLIDGRNVLDLAAWRRAGWDASGLGRH